MTDQAGQTMPILVDGPRGASRYSDVVQAGIAALAYFRDQPMTNEHRIVMGKHGDADTIIVEIRRARQFLGFLRSGNETARG